MKPRSSAATAPRAVETTSTPLESAAIGQELADAKQALDDALEKIDMEVERRRQAENEFERLVATERERMRKRLHDGLGQALTSVSFLASSLKSRLRANGVTEAPELDEIIALINEAVAESRSIAAGLDQTPRGAAARAIIG